MKETVHVFHHPRTGNWIEMALDEKTGGYKLWLTMPVCADENFLRDLKRWIRAIGRGWQKRNSKSICNGDQTVTANFSSQHLRSPPAQR